MTKAQAKKDERNEAIQRIQAFRGLKIYANVVHISRSGMTRHIKFYAEKAGTLDRITYSIAKILDYRVAKDDGLIVNGCGMDMIFSVLSNLNYTMAQVDTGKTIQELLQTKEFGVHIYDKYFFDANSYVML